MQREREGKKWWGLDVFGKVAQQGEIDLRSLFAVADEKEHFGEEVALVDEELGILPEEVFGMFGEQRVNVILNKSSTNTAWLINGVKIVARDCLANLTDLPEAVRVMFLYYPHSDILVLENFSGKRIYVRDGFAAVYTSKLIYRKVEKRD
ncbi:MAG: hypothetical protein WC242_01660 [Candidatus Paceibacterota bacterium]|jgi:hypothetical protein